MGKYSLRLVKARKQMQNIEEIDIPVCRGEYHICLTMFSDEAPFECLDIVPRGEFALVRFGNRDVQPVLAITFGRNGFNDGDGLRCPGAGLSATNARVQVIH